MLPFMGAGDSASEKARRQREQAARLTRSAELWERGAQGEHLVAAALATLGPKWAVMHDMRWPGRRFANIDHVAVGPGGIFVIDAKNWSGKITVTGGVLRQNGYRREKEVASCADAAIAVGEVIPDHIAHVSGVLCFVGDVSVEGLCRDVHLTTTTTLPDFLTSQPVVLSAAEIQSVLAQLRSNTGDASGYGSQLPGHRRSASNHSVIPFPATGRPTKGRRRRLLPLVIGLAFIPLALIAVLLAVSIFAGALSHLAVKPPVPAVAQPTTKVTTSGGFVVYKVYANGYQAARVVAWNQGRRGTLHLNNQALPWTRRVPKRDFALPVYVLSAMSTGTGGITCEIDVDGVVVAKSSGPTSAFCD